MDVDGTRRGSGAEGGGGDRLRDGVVAMVGRRYMTMVLGLDERGSGEEGGGVEEKKGLRGCRGSGVGKTLKSLPVCGTKCYMSYVR